MPTRQGSIRLFKLFGITVYLHWAWFIAIYWFVSQAKGYSSPVWSVLEGISLFAIVLIHEFGHQLACRSVGGQTHDIVLWPLGGVAYVSPPQRPGAQLWSIAAGPLVNVILFPILSAALWLGAHAAEIDSPPDWFRFINNVWAINLVLLVFNMLPIYPLDGGQILRSLLWFPFGRANSLLISSIIGLIGVGGLILLAIINFLTATNPNQQQHAVWLGVLCAFIVFNCWIGFQQARTLMKLAKAPRREGYFCPNCKAAPPRAPVWRCGKCRNAFDTFESEGVCPNCGTQFSVTSCPECGSLRPISEWKATSASPPI
jgi:Zn-dependent protease